MKAKEFLPLFINATADVKDYAKSLAYYVDRKTSVARDLQRIFIQLCSEDILFLPNGDIDESVFPKELWFHPVAITPLTINGGEVDDPSMKIMISGKELALAIAASHVSAYDDNIGVVSFIGDDYTSTVGEIFKHSHRDYEQYLTGKVTRLEITNLPYGVSVDGGLTYSRSLILTPDTASAVTMRDPMSYPEVEFDIIDTIENMSNIVNDNIFLVSVLDYLSSHTQVSLSDIKATLQQHITPEAVELVLERNVKTMSIIAAQNHDSSEVSKLVIQSLFEEVDEIESNADNISDNEDDHFVFSKQNYTGVMASSLWNAATFSTSFQTAALITSAVLSAAGKLLFTAMKGLWSWGGKLWTKYVEPAYESKDFVEGSRDAVSDNYIDVPMFAVGDVDSNKSLVIDSDAIKEYVTSQLLTTRSLSEEVPVSYKFSDASGADIPPGCLALSKPPKLSFPKLPSTFALETEPDEYGSYRMLSDAVYYGVRVRDAVFDGASWYYGTNAADRLNKLREACEDVVEVSDQALGIISITDDYDNLLFKSPRWSEATMLDSGFKINSRNGVYNCLSGTLFDTSGFHPAGPSLGGSPLDPEIILNGIEARFEFDKRTGFFEVSIGSSSWSDERIWCQVPLPDINSSGPQPTGRTISVRTTGVTVTHPYMPDYSEPFVPNAHSLQFSEYGYYCILNLSINNQLHSMYNHYAFWSGDIIIQTQYGDYGREVTVIPVTISTSTSDYNVIQIEFGAITLNFQGTFNGSRFELSPQTDANTNDLYFEKHASVKVLRGKALALKTNHNDLPGLNDQWEYQVKSVRVEQLPDNVILAMEEGGIINISDLSFFHILNVVSNNEFYLSVSPEHLLSLQYFGTDEFPSDIWNAEPGLTIIMPESFGAPINDKSKWMYCTHTWSDLNNVDLVDGMAIGGVAGYADSWYVNFIIRSTELSQQYIQGCAAIDTYDSSLLGPYARVVYAELSAPCYYDESEQYKRCEWISSRDLVEAMEFDDCVRAVRYSMPPDYLSPESLSSLFKEVTSPVDAGCACISKYSFGAVQVMSGSDGALRFTAFLNPINHKGWLTDSMHTRISYFDNSYGFVSSSQEEYLIEDTEENATEIESTILAMLKESMTPESSYVGEEGDGLAYADTLAAKYLFDFFAWMLSNPELDLSEYFKIMAKSNEGWLWQTMNSGGLLPDSRLGYPSTASNLDFINLIYDTASINSETRLSSFLMSYVYRILSNKASFMRIHYLLYSEYPGFFPYVIGNKMAPARWHISTDADIRDYVDSLCTAVLMAAAILAAVIILGAVTHGIRKSIKLKQIKHEERQHRFKTLSAKNADDVYNDKQRIRSLRSQLSHETDPDRMAAIQSELSSSVESLNIKMRNARQYTMQLYKSQRRQSKWAALAVMFGVRPSSHSIASSSESAVFLNSEADEGMVIDDYSMELIMREEETTRRAIQDSTNSVKEEFTARVDGLADTNVTQAELLSSSLQMVKADIISEVNELDEITKDNTESINDHSTSQVEGMTLAVNGIAEAIESLRESTLTRFDNMGDSMPSM